MPVSFGFKACYRHPTKPAIRDCLSCERPICRECEEESSDPGLCAPCKEAPAQTPDEPSGQSQKPAGSPAEQEGPFAVGEVTVFDDGTVVTPDPPQRAVADQIELNSDAVAADQPLPAVIDEARLNVDLRAKELPLLDRGEEQRQERTRPWSQIAYGVPYALAAGALVSCAWLLIALFGKQWSQVSVLTLGLVVPWALFNSSTRKKRLGIRVWKETPPLIMISITSFAIFAVMTPVVEFLAFKAVYGSNPSNLPYSDFVQRYFKGTDWLLVACGLVLSLLTPFLLKVGAEWSKPSVRRKSGEAELTQQAEASKAELAADTAGAKQQLQAEDEEAAPDADVEADTEE